MVVENEKKKFKFIKSRCYICSRYSKETCTHAVYC